MIDPLVLDQILNSRIRRRVLELPVTYSKGRANPVHPKTGRRLRVPRPASLTAPVQRKCPVRVGGEYTLKTDVPYDRHLTRVEGEPTRARAILCLIDRCWQPTRTVTVTVTAVQRVEDQWIVQFRKGSHPELVDGDVFLSRQNDFTMDASRQTVKGDPPLTALFSEDLDRAREKALERRVSPQRAAVRRQIADVETCRDVMDSMKRRNRVARALKELQKVEAELAVEESATLPASRSIGRDALPA